MIALQDVQDARPVIAPYTRRTPLEHSHTLSQLQGTEVYVKLELFQKTGSFKPRGAINQIMALGLPVIIIMPEFTQGYGARIDLMPDLSSCFATAGEMAQILKSCA